MFVALRVLQCMYPASASTIFLHCQHQAFVYTYTYSSKLQRRSFQRLGHAMRLSKWGSEFWATPRAWSSNYFTISTTASPFATCTASDRDWGSNILNGYLNISDEWIVHDEAGSPSVGRSKSVISNCSALINHDHELVAPSLGCQPSTFR